MNLRQARNSKHALVRRFHKRWLAARAEYLEMARKIVTNALTKP